MKEPGDKEWLGNESSEFIMLELLPDAEFDVGQLSGDVTWLQNDHIKQVIAGLLEQTAGWGGKYSKLVDERALTKLLDTLTMLGIPPELTVNLVPYYEGGVQAEWHHGTKGLEISVQQEGALNAMAWSGKEREYSIEVINASSFSEITTMAVRKMLSHLYELSRRT